MAGKTKIGKSILTFIVLAFMIAIFCVIIFVAVAPLILLIGTVFYRIRFIRIKKRLRNQLSDFWLTDEEKKEFKSLAMKRNEYAKIIDDAEKEAKKAGIHINKDGRYSTKSNLGKKIREIYGDYLPIKEEIDERLQELQEQPLKKWNLFNSMASSSKVYQVTLIIWLGIVSYYLSSAYKQGDFDLNATAILSYCWVGLRDVFAYALSIFGIGYEITGYKITNIYQHESFQMICFSFGGAIIGFLVFKIIFSDYGKNFSPRPPKVTPENIDLLNVSKDKL